MGLTDHTDKNSADDVSAKRLADALSRYEMIKSLKLSDQATEPGDENTLELPLSVVMEAVPHDYVENEDLSGHETEKVPVGVAGLFDQLARGRVAVPLSKLVFGIPSHLHLVTSEAFKAQHISVSLPLSAVVSSLDPGMFTSRAAKTLRTEDVDFLPDPFKVAKQPVAPVVAPVAAPAVTPVAAPAVPVVPVEPPPVPPSETVQPPEVLAKEEPLPSVPTAAPQPPEAPPPLPETPAPEAEMERAETTMEPERRETEPVPIQPAEDELVQPTVEARSPAIPEETHLKEAPLSPLEAEGTEESERLGGVNLNTATEDVLISLGISHALARNIIEYRSREGAFRSVFDLAKVAGIGRKTFKKITGMAYSEKGVSRRQKLARLLGLPADKIDHLPSIAGAVAAQTGFAGCVISDRDGLLLSESGATAYAQALSAVIPRLLQQVSDNTKELAMGSVESVSVCLEGKMLTIITSGKLCLTAVHSRNKLTQSQWMLIRHSAQEIEWLLSYRGYVGAAS